MGQADRGGGLLDLVHHGVVRARDRAVEGRLSLDDEGAGRDLAALARVLQCPQPTPDWGWEPASVQAIQSWRAFAYRDVAAGGYVRARCDHHTNGREAILATLDLVERPVVRAAVHDDDLVRHLRLLRQGVEQVGEAPPVVPHCDNQRDGQI